MGYLPSQIQALRKAQAEAEKAGQPEVANRIRKAMAADESAESILNTLLENPTNQTIFPETEVHADDAAAMVPPRAGKGASKLAWRAFALAVSAIEPDVIEGFSRDDIISVLEDRGIILPEPI